MKTPTKGDAIIEDIKIGDVLYEFDTGCCIRSRVITLPILQDEVYCWDCINLKTGKQIGYSVLKQYAGHTQLGLNLYTYEAYEGCIYV